MSETYDVAVVGAGVVALAVAEELLARGLTVTVVGPYGGDHAGQASAAAGAMLSTFSEIEPGHPADRVAVETGERLAAHRAYPAWLSRLAASGQPAVSTIAGTWVLAPAGRLAQLAPIAAAARAAGHPAEEHDAGQIPGLRTPAGTAAALWLPTEARGSRPAASCWRPAPRARRCWNGPDARSGCRRPARSNTKTGPPQLPHTTRARLSGITIRNDATKSEPEPVDVSGAQRTCAIA